MTGRRARGRALFVFVLVAAGIGLPAPLRAEYAVKKFIVNTGDPGSVAYLANLIGYLNSPAQ